VSEAQANRRGARRPAEDLDPRRARSTGYHWAFVHGCGQPEAPARRVTSRSRHCPSRTSLTVTGMVMTASYPGALTRSKAQDPSSCRRPWCIPPPHRTATPLGRAPGLPSHHSACGATRATAVGSRGALPPMHAHPTATERCHYQYDHAGVPADIRCGPVECQVTGRPDGRDRESRPVGESPRWP
jgi:hypothetical protein